MDAQQNPRQKQRQAAFAQHSGQSRLVAPYDSQTRTVVRRQAHDQTFPQQVGLIDQPVFDSCDKLRSTPRDFQDSLLDHHIRVQCLT